MNNNIANSISAIIGAAVIGVILFMGIQRVDTYLKIKAIDDCQKEARYETTAPDGAKVSYPIADMVKTCLKDKGY